jgi:hypothetical protein
MVHAHCHRPASLSLLPLTFFSLAVLGASGCNMNAVSSASSPITFTGHKMQGSVFGGQQPLVGATIQLYAAGTPASGGAYGSGATALITGTLPTTDSNGAFTFTYNYPASPSFFYLVATGGSPGSGNPANPNIVQIAALGGCAASTTLPISFININELTTAASVMALQPFIGAPTGSAGAPDIGAPATNYNDLRTAFESISKLVDMSSGALVNPTGSKGQLLNTMADILAHCVNSDPGSDNYCSTLFADATPVSDITAGDTVQAAWYIAQNPTNNVPALFGLVPPTPPFVALNSAPASFAVTAPTDLVGCFTVLGASTVTNTDSSTVVSGGDLGLYPGTSVTNFTFSSAPGPGTVTAPATEHIADLVAENAQSNLTAAYNYAANLSPTGSLPADMAGSTFFPGVYNNLAAVGLSNNMTLNANGDPDAVFVFQIGAALTTTAGQITLENGAQAKNVYWQVGTSATIDTPFLGTILANDSVTLGTGVTLQGRALASTAAVVLDDNTVTAP